MDSEGPVNRGKRMRRTSTPLDRAAVLDCWKGPEGSKEKLLEDRIISARLVRDVGISWLAKTFEGWASTELSRLHIGISICTGSRHLFCDCGVEKISNNILSNLDYQRQIAPW